MVHIVQTVYCETACIPSYGSHDDKGRACGAHPVGREVGIECDSDERPHVVLASSSTSTGQDSNGPGSTTARDRSTARTHDNNTNRHMLPLKTGEPERAANNARRKTQQPQRSAQHLKAGPAQPSTLKPHVVPGGSCCCLDCLLHKCQVAPAASRNGSIIRLCQWAIGYFCAAHSTRP